MGWRRVAGVAACVVALALGGCGGDGDDAGSDVFSFASDDLCEWVTEDDVAAFVAAEYDWEGTAVEVEAERGGCAWELTGDEFGYVEASDVRQWEDFGGNPIDPRARYGEAALVEFDPDDPGVRTPGFGVVGHPLVSAGVMVFNDGFGQFVFWVPPLEEYLGFSMAVPGEEDVFYEGRFVAVADRFVEQLGWLPEQ